MTKAKRFVGRAVGALVAPLCVLMTVWGGQAQGQVKISQIYAGGGNAGAIYQHDYVELFNASTASVNIGGWTLAYTKADGRAWKSAVVIPDGTVLGSGRYYLIRGVTNGATGGFPAVTPDLTSTINLSSDSGKLLLYGGGAVSALTGASCPTAQQVIDFVGYGPRATCAEPQGVLPARVAPSPGSTQLLSRKSSGCQDGNDNSVDFVLTTNSLRSLASPARACGSAFNLAITVTRTPEVVGSVPGDIAYSVTVSNVGAATVGGVQVTGIFPGGSTLVGITGASGSYVGNQLTVPIGTLAAGIVAPMFTVTMRANAEYLPATPFAATFTVNPTGGDSDVSNNSAAITTVVRRSADVESVINGPASCDLWVGASMTFQLIVRNIGQLPASAVSAAVTFPAQAVLNGFGGAGSFAPSGDGGVWTIGSLMPGQVVSMTLTLDLTGPGGMSLEMNASTTSLEVNTTNNLDRFSQFVTSPDQPIAVLATSVADSDSSIANVPGVTPGTARYSGQIYAFGRPFISPNGQYWTLVADTDLPEANNSLVLVGQGTEYGVAAREGVTLLPGGGFPGAPFGVGEAVFGRVLAVGDDGRVAFSCKSTTGNGRMSVVRGTPSVPSTYPYTLSGVARTNQSVTGLGQGVTYGSSLSVNGLQLDGRVTFTSTLNGLASAINEAVFADSGQTILALKGDTAGLRAGRGRRSR